MSSPCHCISLPRLAENWCQWVSRSASLTRKLGFYLSPPSGPGQSLGTDGGGDACTLGNGEGCFWAAAAPCLLLQGSTGIPSASCEGNEIEEDFSGPCPLIVSEGGNSPLANDYR